MGDSTFSRRISEILGVALFALALIWLISLVTYEPTDPVWFFTTESTEPPANFVGRIGAFLAELSFQLFGYASYLLPAVIAVIGWHYFWCQPPDAAYTKIVGVLLLFACSSAFLSLVFGGADVDGKTFHAGGSVGTWLAGELAEYLNRTGSVIVLATLTILSVILSTQFSFGRMFEHASRNSRDLSARGVGRFRMWVEERRKQRQRQEVIARHTGRIVKEGGKGRGGKRKEGRRRRKGEGRKGEDGGRRKPDEEAAEAAASRGAAPPVVARKRSEVTPSLLPEPEPVKAAPRRQGAFTLPPPSLLDAPRTEHKIDERELMEAARQLEEKCREFSVEGQVAQIHPGPVVTTFEFKPEAGVKYSKVTGLSDDLCLAMQAESVLIERIPGKSTVGIQIPNPNREPISLRELLESDAYQRSPSKLTLALGKTIHGEPYVTDLATMPHLLIAGSTGTGKSVGLNAMLTSILYRATPDDVRMIMIDPKRLELGVYEEIPHLLTPVVVDPKKAANALRWAVREMEERYKTLAAEGVRNIEQYNRNVRLLLQERGAAAALDPDAPKFLPFVVVVIDELADLMMVASNEVEESIARLAQMARAVGIHLILATQRPSVDVITGLIKANLPSRISFRVSSKVDSRTIIDGNGAEQLLGKGDMLFLPPASSRCIRLHGPYISEQESARLASFLRKQGKPVFDDSITDEDEKAGAGAIDSRKRRAVRRSGTTGRRERPGLHLLPATQDANRVQPCRAPRGHDGSRRARVPGRRRQAARGARGARVLRGCGCTASLAGARRAARAHRPWRYCCGWRRLRRSHRRTPRVCTATRCARKRNSARSSTTGRAMPLQLPCSSGRARSLKPTRTSSGSSRKAATVTTRCGRLPSSPATRSGSSARRADRVLALRLFRLLQARYPASSLLKQVPAQTARLEAAEAVPAELAPPVHRDAARVATPPRVSSTLRSIRREVLPDALRVTLELDREVAFYDERIAGPPRVFIDLQNTRAVERSRMPR